MHVYILDPGLLNRHGHHFHTDLAIHQECLDRGLGVTAVGNRAVEDAIQAHMPVARVFEATAYPSRDGHADRDLRADVEAFNAMVERDLRGARLEPGPDDLLLVPTARDIHLTGILRWYESLPGPRPRVCLRLLFAPWFRTKPDERALSVDLAREQMAGWARVDRDRLDVVAESEPLAAYFRELSGLPVRAVPMPIRYPRSEAPPPTPRANGSLHLVFLGEARQEKGFHLLHDALASVLEAHPTVRLTVQTSCLFDVGPEEVARLEALSPGVRAVDRILTVEEYDRLLVSGDVVLVPYCPDRYRFRTSQVFLEAVGAGKAVVTTPGTWMADELAALGLPDDYLGAFTGPGIGAAVSRLVEDWPAIEARARAGAPRVRERHNPRAFVDALLDGCRTE